jgi:hypothetical protein
MGWEDQSQKEDQRPFDRQDAPARSLPILCDSSRSDGQNQIHAYRIKGNDLSLATMSANRSWERFGINPQMAFEVLHPSDAEARYVAAT